VPNLHSRKMYVTYEFGKNDVTGQNYKKVRRPCLTVYLCEIFTTRSVAHCP
jgi:hypothetical protein